MTKTIAFDTSNQPLSVALFDADHVIAQIETNISRNQSEQLLPAIDQLVSDAGWVAGDLERVVVSAGPGSYTGLRIGVTTAKTLAYTLGLELVGISSLGLLAANVKNEDTIIVPVMDARNDNLYAAAYEWVDGQLVAHLADQHTNITALLEKLAAFNGRQLMFVGDLERFNDRILVAYPDAKVAEDTLPHAANSLVLAQQATVITEMDDIHQFVPNYHRLSQAEADWARAHPEEEVGYVERV
ncbi:tRNA (adenosine(37)-N6)-threonylcarbamoyltransferase complex dimerization subunit type 1 TsaB [Weissella tructae]|uniref:Glycoprotein endopeptidase, M22 family n=2 Tax=Weissella TaxID=46255 RepID=A0A075U0L9_9LACO|nr:MULTISPECIES: tRNA (adenosine(37)-N6)-threonylcarbamoyltransferase complex dimerization subunit type 1 TsaB [Weissella]AIG66041.1 Glycoprotein endopeptidase, M22 family [Weissella tructae]AIM63420.1 Glycoprotein endopeptidase, M22 family [Weissella ceti]AIM64755.1 Glycoprotein endopeptidase, M22 family [Weissella ceti]ELA07412.1 glycoprotein endopeptidase [Weissella ceti NC36]QVV91194.1 tRNA (adenosine(37)-N6)-threonylcarbamoyltransferase complex dimerization subunit type 1 TsaB [Weissella 